VRIEVLVTRKIRDLVRDAAENVLILVRKGIVGVSRGELWTFEVESDDARSEIRRILDETTLLVNPNLHHYTLDSWRRAPETGCRLLVHVSEGIDARGEAVLRAIRERRGIESVTSASSSILWAIDLDGSGEEEAMELGREITGDEGRGAGLLANRHAQDVRLEVMTA
jgi:phosphoribosylformylglycinamidine (FGAM) synthase PurS component